VYYYVISGILLCNIM